MRKILTVLLLTLSLTILLTGCGMRNNDKTNIGSDIQSQADRITSGIDSALDGTMDSMQSDNVRITEEAAKKTALEHAGISESDASNIRANLDRDDGVLYYDVEFMSGTTEYDYEIHAETGEIISHDKDIDD